jgi:hypothetical protein
MDAAASLQTRIDSKYIVPWDIFNDLQQSLLQTHRALEIDGQRIFTYETQYFDTPAHGLYRAHIQGQRKRFKIRTRRYVEAGHAFLEIKLKGSRGETIKKRIPHDPAHLDVMNGDASLFVQQCIENLYGDAFTEPLVPTVKTLYRRATLVARGHAERITCDFDLGFEQSGTSQGVLRPQYVLIEIKTARGRGASDRKLWSRGVRPMGGSKYCIGLSMTSEEMKNNALRRQIRLFYR